jgi:biotin transport system substrate-specific component
MVLRDLTTGSEIEVPSRILLAPASEATGQELRKRLRSADVQSAWAGPSDADVTVDTAKLTYAFKRYPPLGFFVDMRLFLVLGAFFIAGCAQLRFLFPCTSGYTVVDRGADSFCVPDQSLSSVTASSCPVSVCSKRIPVTMQTFAVMLMGAVAGQAGALATLIYVAMVCVGAPFGADGLSKPVWNKGAIVSSSGGYFYGFIFASLIMGRAAERGHGRFTWRSAFWMTVWMLGAELAIYACGLFWMPFGLAIARNSSPSAVCPASEGASKCLQKIFDWGLVPFIPGELFKMGLILLAVPASWAGLLRFHEWRTGGAKAVGQQEELEDAEAASVEAGSREAAASSSSSSSRNLDDPSGITPDGRTVSSTGLTLREGAALPGTA